jgi:putative endonuclease
MDTKKLGKIGERYACDYLVKLGYKIIEVNYFSKMGEIDIIASYKDEIRFVEVKYRKFESQINISELVSRSKFRKISNTAKYWMLKQNMNIYDTKFGFDFLGIIGQDEKTLKYTFIREINI